MFSFNTTAGASQSTSKPRLKGNEIYEVKFDGCEIQDIKGVKNADLTYKVIKLKFSNDDGSFEHTVFEPRPEDFKETETEFTKDGKTSKIKQPSGVTNMMLLFKHAIDAINPTIASQIDKGEKELTASSWDKLRDLVAKILDAKKGATTKIKLVSGKDGEARFPGFFTAYNKEGKAYIRNNFIGAKIAFTPYEITKLTNASTAKPNNVDNFTPEVGGDQVDTSLDLDFDL